MKLGSIVVIILAVVVLGAFIAAAFGALGILAGIAVIFYMLGEIIMSALNLCWDIGWWIGTKLGALVTGRERKA